MQHSGPYWLPPRRAPFGRRAGQPSERAPTHTALSPRASKRRGVPMCRCCEKSARLRGSARTRTPSLAIFSTSGTYRDGSRMGTELRIVAAEARAVRSSGKRGQHRLRWYACPRLTLFATEWSAARRKPIRAAVVHLSATISADVKARRLPTSHRRKFPSGNFRSARDLREQRESAVGRRIANPKRPRLPEDRTARASATASNQVRPRLPGIEECPHFIALGCLRSRDTKRPSHSSRRPRRGTRTPVRLPWVAPAASAVRSCRTP